jgi:hypothetical protein
MQNAKRVALRVNPAAPTPARERARKAGAPSEWLPRGALSAKPGGPRIASTPGMTPPLAPNVDLHVADPTRLHSESMSGLSALLLDWRVECERHLRALTSIQRWLERVRCGAAGDGERELLLQEMGRLLHEPLPDHQEWTRRADMYLNNLSSECVSQLSAARRELINT